jgi:hypothetical protein
VGHGRDPRWLQTGWGHRVNSADELLRAVGRIGTLATGRRYVWRGVGDWRWRVRSSLVRTMMAPLSDDEPVPAEPLVRDRELALLEAARRWGLGRETGGVASDLHLLALMQHHGVPTRLLDVTSNPMTAIWFACQAATQDRDASGAVMAFDVTGLSTLPTATTELAPTWGSMGNPLRWHLENALEESSRDGHPFIVEPSYPDQRMRAQEGLFISGAVPTTPEPPGVDGLPLLDENAPGARALEVLFAPAERTAGRPRSLPFVVLVVPPALKRRMRDPLATTYNRSRRTLFPDVAGFAEAVRAGDLV